MKRVEWGLPGDQTVEGGAVEEGDRMMGSRCVFRGGGFFFKISSFCIRPCSAMTV